MRDDDVLPVSTSTSSPSIAFGSSSRKDVPSVSSAVFGRGRYKFWALALILMLAFWSILTGTVSLRWSAGDLDDSFSREHHSPSADDLDVLDLEEREKLVRHMWDVYTNNQKMKLAGFWQEAFVAAYEDLTSELPEVREDAISEIARMSAPHVDLTPPSPQRTSLSLGLQNLNVENIKQTQQRQSGSQQLD